MILKHGIYFYGVTVETALIKQKLIHKKIGVIKIWQRHAQTLVAYSDTLDSIE
ncbi:MAG: hypothetical protein K0S41_3329 [Anaerocolumna sp.]|jgi:K+/H+ antiporter YhaU regulatory subunit KhtT|nr:hypothetical protein [Anaerocolumna sp.]